MLIRSVGTTWADPSQVRENYWLGGVGGAAESRAPSKQAALLARNKLGPYALFGILAMASSIPFFISSMDRSALWVPIDHLWPKGSRSLP